MEMIKNRTNLKVLIVGILLLIIFELVIFVSNAFISQTEENELYRKSYSIQTEIERVFSSVFTINDAYLSYISDSPDFSQEESETFLHHLLFYEEHFVNNIAYIEDTTIKYNYPYEENSDSIGVDLALIPGQSEDILFVKNYHEPMFIGPVELVQGGTAFILRTPVITDGVYQGQIATVIDAEEFITLLNHEADRFNVELEISYPNADSIISVGEDFDAQSVKSDFSNKYVDLELTVYDLSDTESYFLMSMGLRIIGIFVTSIVCYYVYKNSSLIEEVRYKANHDSLTKNYNRAKFVDDYQNGRFVGKLIAFTDINKFKLLNDTLGHHYGDWGLIKISSEFRSTGKFRTYRSSGDEFFLVSNEPMKEEEFLKYTDQFNQSYYNEELRQDVEITLSVGVIEDVSIDLKLETMLMYLDYAMYDAKKQGLTYTLVNDKLMARYNEQKIIEDLLIDDIKSNNFLTYYQPIIDIENKKIDSLEVLSRWKYNGNLIPASRFIDIIKKIKYIEKVDHNLFSNLQKEYQLIKDQCIDIDNINFTINLSAEILKVFERDFSKFDSYVSQATLPPSKTIFEISEDINLGIISNETLDYIKSKGYRLVIDDFGSGISKLSDVLSGKLFAIKTDKSMIPKDLKDVKRLNGFNTIVKAVNSTGSMVCVEGVETKEQLKISVDAGCKVLQGYYFGRPMSLQDIINYINTFDFTNY